MDNADMVVGPKLCRDCGVMVSAEREQCPECGAMLNSVADQEAKGSTVGSSLTKGCLSIVGIFVLLAFIGSLIGGDDSVGNRGKPSEEDKVISENSEIIVDEPQNDPGISASEFNQLRTGMNQEEVFAIVGSAGELMSETNVAGIHTVMYMWEGESGFGANANAMFQDGKLIQKAQFGLE